MVMFVDSTKGHVTTSEEIGHVEVERSTNRMLSKRFRSTLCEGKCSPASRQIEWFVLVSLVCWVHRRKTAYWRLAVGILS